MCTNNDRKYISQMEMTCCFADASLNSFACVIFSSCICLRHEQTQQFCLLTTPVKFMWMYNNNNKLCGRWCGRHGNPPPACNNPTLQAFIAGFGSWQRMLQPLTTFAVHRRHSSVSALISLVTLTFDLEPSARYWPSGKQPSYQFWCYWDFSFSTYVATTVKRTTWPCNLDL